MQQITMLISSCLKINRNENKFPKILKQPFNSLNFHTTNYTLLTWNLTLSFSQALSRLLKGAQK